MPSTTSSADGPAKKRPSAKEELERTMRRHETHADHVARDLAERRKDATEKVAKLTSTLVSGINRGVLEVFENQKQVEKEAKNLQKKKWTPLKSKAPSG